MFKSSITDSVHTSEVSRLAKQQWGILAFSLLLNLSALAIGLSRSSGLPWMNALLFINSILLVAWGWTERRKTAEESRSISDEQTGALTTKAFERVLNEELRRAGRYHYPVAVCFLELDDFLSYNKNFGEEKGWVLLREFSKLLRTTVRYSDTVGRAQKDEFLVLLPHTDLLRAQKFLMRALTESSEKLNVSFSSGLTIYQAGEKQSDLLGRLELALRAAQKEGRKKFKALIAGQDMQTIISF